MKTLFACVLLTCGVVAFAVFAAPPTTALNTSNTARVPVLLELFTSEGCSSCPPADRVLEALDRQPIANADLIVLSEHVDYWNYLGWSDPYSSAFFSDRQHKYADRLGTTVYTPQLVIDGQFEVLGSDQAEVMRTIAQAAQKAKLPISVRAAGSGNPGAVHVEANSGGMNADLYIVVAADRARSQVLRGENGGRVLTHVAVAESIARIGKWDGAGESARDISIPWISGKGRPGETRIVAILQDSRSGKILGAAQTRIPAAIQNAGFEEANPASSRK